MNNNEKNINETIEIFTDYIDSEGYVLRYNYEKGYYYNTGICLKGSLGNPGRPGRPGKDGDSWDLQQVNGVYYWFKNGINQHIPAQTSGGGGTPDLSGLATVATTGDYNDLENKPTIPIKTSLLTNDAGFLTLHQDISGKADKSELFSGDYDDLTNKPTIPTKTSDLTNNSGFLTLHLDISGKVNSSDLATVATSGNYNDLSNKPNILTYENSEFVDLGLPSGLLWCTHNIGASTPQERGLHFSWGNIEGHLLEEGYNFSENYSETPGNSLTENIPVNDTYDAAYHIMGPLCRIPTSSDFEELVNNCTFTWTTQDNLNGALFTSNINGNSIFIPAVGYIYSDEVSGNNTTGNYWSSTSKNTTPKFNLAFNSWGVNPADDSSRVNGFPIRPVAIKPNTLHKIAVSGSYNDLSNKPTIPTKTSDLSNDSNYMSGLTVLSYGTSTWNDFINVYSKNQVVYCRASSNSNPATGSQNRLAFMAYVNDTTSPTEVEFQYYRSLSNHSSSQQGDQVYIYKLTNTNTWTVTVREASSKVAVGNGLDLSYSNGVLTLSSKIWVGTQNEYDAIVTKDASTIYIIK